MTCTFLRAIAHGVTAMVASSILCISGVHADEPTPSIAIVEDLVAMKDLKAAFQRGREIPDRAQP